MAAFTLWLVAALTAAPTLASPPLEALRMAWDDCPTSPGASINRLFTCDTNIGSSALFCAFSVLQPIDQIIGLEIVVDVQHSLSSLPDYWRLGPSPQCRHDMLSASVDFSAANECASPGFTGAVLQDYLITEPRGLQSQARIKAVVFVPSPETRSVANDTTYHAVRLVFSHDRTVNVNVCTGCASPACLVLNSVTVRRVKGAFGGDITLSGPGPGNANWAFWRSVVGADCSLVPVRTLTWGSVKSLYR
ncbi:MAG: hypothetical protein ABIS67_13710 [Candidatus Eisenbacteria bacterium]